MQTQVSLYTTSDDKLCRIKNLTLIQETQCIITMPCNILGPIVKIKYFPEVSSVNYIYIPEFKRFYFSKAPTLQAGSTAIFDCSVDVLGSYANYIGAMDVTIDRNEYFQNKYIADSLIPLNTYNTYEVIRLDNTIMTLNTATADGKYYLLSTMGGRTV